MKKILSLILFAAIVLSFAGCAGGKQNETTQDETESESFPIVTLVCDNTKVSAGEEIEVKVHIDNAPRTACFDIYVYADETVSYVTSETVSSELILASNVDEANPVCVKIRGIVAATFDILDSNICTIKYKVADDVKSGSKISLSVLCPSYQVGFDESGNDVYAVEKDVVLNGLVLTVK